MMTNRQTSTIRKSRAALFALLIGVPVLAVSAKAAVVAYYAAPAAVAVPAHSSVAYVSEDRLPGAAASVGTTGTVDIGALPIPANAVLTPDLDGTVKAARPFSMAGVGSLDRARALDCLSTAIYYEAASESDDGQRAVAQVILNRVRHPAFPSTVCGVVYQGSERASGCQFSYACDGAMARPRSAAGMARATRIAADALNGYVMGAVGMATHYHTYAVTPAWNRSLVMTDAIGAHFFHRWKGYWGTPAAFSNARYRGGEPAPGPYRTVDPLLPLTPASVAMGATPPVAAPAAKVDVPSIQPTYQDVSVAKTDNLPGDSQILDRWKDSGKPLR